MTEKLEEYNQKRNFEKTTEPESTSYGKREDTINTLRFVVQHHIARREHFDFRLEWEGVLLSWAVPKGPSYNPRDKRLAVLVEDHPLEYSSFEGTIPKGEYGGGTVMLWDEGFWEPQFDVNEGLNKGSLKFVLKGRRLQGKWALVRLKTKEKETQDNWLLLKERDEFAKNENGISEYTTSIRTGRNMAEIEAGEEAKTVKNPFNTANVQLAKLVNKIPDTEDWLYELKYDGYRILAYLEGNRARLVSRNQNDFTSRFSDVACSLSGWSAGRAMVLDGEMVVTDEKGRTDFQALQNYMKNPGGRNLSYIVFDLLALDGKDIREQPLFQRKALLDDLLKDCPENIGYSQFIKGNGNESFRAACELNLEGIIGKKTHSVYSGTRNGDWVKLKCGTRQEFVIGGYTLSDKKTSGISSLLLGVYDHNELIYTGRAGTGLSQSSMRELEKKFEPLKRDTAPFKQAPQSKKSEQITWLEPVMAAEIKFAEWTEDHLLRQASFKGLREDKDPKAIKMERVHNDMQSDENRSKKPAPTVSPEKPITPKGNVISIGGIKITNPDKMLFEEPKVTKADVVRYYAAVSDRMLPYVSKRVLSIVRCPKGIGSPCFYKKHPLSDSKGVVVLPVTTGSGETEDYFYIENASGLLYEAQMGTLEFHTWGSRVDRLEKPDTMVFDLDPDEGMDIAQVCQGVKDIKSVLDRLSLVSFLKTSGGKGYHVVVPFEPSVEWAPFHDFARRVAEVMEQQWPDRYTGNVRKEKRRNKIFIDWIRNGRGATSIAPYSIRARKGARVSMPVPWAQLDTVAPDGVDMANALSRINNEDPWKDFFSVQQRLKL